MRTLWVMVSCFLLAPTGPIQGQGPPSIPPTQHRASDPPAKKSGDDPQPPPVPQPLVVSVEKSPVEKGSFADITVNANPTDRVAWRVRPAPIKMVNLNNRLLFNGPDGAYDVDLTIVNFKAERFDTASVQVVIGTVAPVPNPVPPGPGPNPGPNPGPTPNDPTKLWIVIVEETQDSAADASNIFSDQALSKRVQEKGHRWRVVDKDVVSANGQPPADLKPYIDRAKGKAYPQMFLVDPNGGVRYEGPRPKTAKEILDLIQQKGG